MFFQTIAHHAHYDYAERIFVQTYPTLSAIDDQSCFRYLVDFAKWSKNPRCYKGAAVLAIGHGNADVTKTIVTQLDQIAYCFPGFYQTDIEQDLSYSLVNPTGGKMQKTFLTGSGTLPRSMPQLSLIW